MCLVRRLQDSTFQGADSSRSGRVKGSGDQLMIERATSLAVVRAARLREDDKIHAQGSTCRRNLSIALDIRCDQDTASGLPVLNLIKEIFQHRVSIHASGIMPVGLCLRYHASSVMPAVPWFRRVYWIANQRHALSRSRCRENGITE